MIKCGITGHNGNLGRKFQKISKKFKFIKFNGDISKKKDVENALKAKKRGAAGQTAPAYGLFLFSVKY